MEWLRPWVPLSDLTRDSAAGFENELYREIGVGHPLYKIPVEAIGSNNTCDDVLFRLLDGSNRVAVVHLTWTRIPPEHPPWPETVIYADIHSWAERRMTPDHLDFPHEPYDS